VDISKGPWIMRLGATPNVTSTWLFLIKIGVPANTVAYFMNQPIVKDYLRTLENNGYTWLFNDKIIANTLEAYDPNITALRSTEVSGIPSEEELFKMLKYNKEGMKGDMNDVQKLQQQLEFIEAYKPYVKFVVSQTGSLTKHTQVGKFVPSDNVQIAELIHNNGMLFKEHNADYLSAAEVNLRKTTGVDAINIAPQLGSVQSSVMLEYKHHYPTLYETFYNDVIESGYWKKWVTPDISDNDTRFIASAHYCYGYTSGKLLLDELLNNIDFTETLKMRLYDALDQYRIGYEL
jgi:hypothetical protein